MLIAITGGIGSGKTTVLQMLSSLGGNIINTDEINNELLTQDFYIEKISALFPTAVVGGKIDKARLANIVFYDKEALAQLNQLAHPLINKQVLIRAEALAGNVFVEIPLLIEADMQDAFDRIWLVKASIALRLKRILERSHLDKELARHIIALQGDDKLRERVATDIIINNGNNQELFNQVQKLYSEL